MIITNSCRSLSHHLCMNWHLILAFLLSLQNRKMRRTLPVTQWKNPMKSLSRVFAKNTITLFWTLIHQPNFALARPVIQRRLKISLWLNVIPKTYQDSYVFTPLLIWSWGRANRGRKIHHHIKIHDFDCYLLQTEMLKWWNEEFKKTKKEVVAINNLKYSVYWSHFFNNSVPFSLRLYFSLPLFG